MAYKSSARGTRPVRLIVLHTTEGALTAASLGAYFYRPDVQASSHVGIGSDGLKQYVSYDRSAWTVRSGNPISDNAELCGYAHWSRAEWLNNHRGTLDLAADWVRSRCLARGIPRRKLNAADVRAGAAGVIGHWDWTVGMSDGTHTDPGGQFPWDYVMQRAAQGGTNTNEEDDLNAEQAQQLSLVYQGMWGMGGPGGGPVHDENGTYGPVLPNLQDTNNDLNTVKADLAAFKAQTTAQLNGIAATVGRIEAKMSGQAG